MPDITADIQALLDGGSTAEEIAQAAMFLSHADAVTVQTSALPDGLPSFTSQQVLDLSTYLLDGTEVPDIDARVLALIAALRAGDEATFLQEALLTLKCLFGVRPDLIVTP